MIAGDPDAFYFRGNRDFFHPEAWAEYSSHLRDPATQHALCEDYRAGATYDYRLALDHPDAVARLAILDILPTGEHFRRADYAFGSARAHHNSDRTKIPCPRP